MKEIIEKIKSLEKHEEITKKIIIVIFNIVLITFVITSALMIAVLNIDIFTNYIIFINTFYLILLNIYVIYIIFKNEVSYFHYSLIFFLLFIQQVI